jgi:predicted AlkP superfamily phosphohydrolase/phosphomutase/tetratricopeptide (TPR) repeat protein
MNSESRRRVLLVGWDAADWKVIHPLMDAGKMPTVARLVERGAMASLHTLHPVLSPMLWTSIATGKRPFKHGVLGFTEPTSDGTAIRPVSNLSRKTKAIWNILSQNGFTSNIVGWWPSHPAEPIRGAMVSNHFQQAYGPPEEPWPIAPGAVHPPELTETLAELRVNPNELWVEHILPFIPRAAEIDQEQDRRLAACGKIIAECTTVNAVATWLMQNRPWDFMAVYFDAIDHFSHAFMRYHPPRQEHVDERDFELYRGVIEAGYRYHDMMLHTLVEMAGPETTVVLMSDHGFHPDHLRPKRLPAEPAAPAHEHRDLGILVISGPDIERDTLVHGVNLLDITPTLLALFGLPVGKDMDGRPILEAFCEPPEIAAIESWDDVPGDAGLHPPDAQLDPLESQAAIDQLVALGYIEPPAADRKQAVDNTVRELRYNLARSYMDDGRQAAAAEILEELYERWPNEHRFGVQLAVCYQALDRVSDMRSVVEDLSTRRQADATAARDELREFAAKVRERQANAASEEEESLTEAERRNVRLLRSRSQYNPRGIDYLWGCVALAECDYEQALGHFAAAATIDANRPGLLLQIGEAYLRLRQADRAAEVYARASAIDPDSPQAHLGLARVQLLRGEFAPAAESALRAIGLRYQLPMAHFLLGKALFRLGRIPRSIEALHEALGINPHFAEAHRLLAVIHRHRLHDFEQARTHRRLAREMRVARRESREAKRRYRSAGPNNTGWLGSNVSDPPVRNAAGGSAEPRPQPPGANDDVSDAPITIVSGLPRSGTSMVMQMLAVGGVDILSDGRREADESNPRGYLELEAVKNLRNDNSWLGEARGKAVKIITQLLPSLPMKYRYRIVYVERDLDEVLASQRRMLAQDGRSTARISDEQLRRTFAAQTKRIRAWLAKQPNVELLTVDYRQVVGDPATAAAAIAGFLQCDCDVAQMAAAVDPQLYRTRV